jgi:hypothetical protein
LNGYTLSCHQLLNFLYQKKMLLKWIEVGLAEAKKKWEENPALLQKQH